MLFFVLLSFLLSMLIALLLSLLLSLSFQQWHNLYGFYMPMATNDGQIKRKEDQSERPFLLSRSFFAGSQRYGAIWTGDNAGRWDHLEISGPMLLSFNVAGLPFIGSDTGGFFGNPNEELMTRW
jgi:alpha 1,3-glucosidase